MIIIKYPDPDFRMKKEGEKEFIFDTIRKKWLLLTSEEWVRQNFVQYLIQKMKYPAALIALEKEIKLGDLKKRFDILIYDDDHQPWMMVECKGMEIKLGESVLQQVLRYNISVPVDNIVITNGTQCYAWKKKNDQLEVQSALPVHGSKL
jgi:hypothetical protein